jgi:hypothetical protein
MCGEDIVLDMNDVANSSPRVGAKMSGDHLTSSLLKS